MPRNRSLDWATVAEYQTGRKFQSYVQFLNNDLKKTSKGDPYYLCTFRDKTGRIESMAWHNSELFRWCQEWKGGDALWIAGSVTQSNPKFKPSLEIIEAKRLEDDPELMQDFDWSLLIQASRWSPESLRDRIFDGLNKTVKDARLIELVRILFDEHWDVLATLPAASKMHHAMQTGWLEHIWSMARLAGIVGGHYARYYDDLNPPVQTDILVIGAVLHDIGKALELSYDSRSDATYTTPGRLMGHIVMGRDMIREAAAKLEKPLDDEQLLRLEHAILSHHGRLEFGSPVAPQTLEAFILGEIDDMDAKVNSIVRALKQSEGTSPDSTSGTLWTEKVFACDPPRTFYRGYQPKASPAEIGEAEPVSNAQTAESGSHVTDIAE